jgi:hypothetical protein
MENNELETFVDALNFLKDRIDEVNVKVDELKDVMFKQIIEPAQEEINSSVQEQLENGYSEFSQKHGETLKPLMDNYKALRPDEPDPMEQLYMEWVNYDGELDEDAYVAQIAELLQKEVDKVKEALGFSDKAEVTDVDVSDGTVEITDPETEESAVVESEVVQDITSEDKVNSPEEIAEFEKKLEAYL